MTEEYIRVLITGARGTIGRIIARNLSGMHMQVVAVTRQQYDIACQKDFSRMMDDIKPTVIIHCAAEGVKRTIQFNQQHLLNNLQMAENIAVHSHKLKHIFNLGSGAEYGIKHNLNSVTESSLERFPLPDDEYGLSKRLSWQRLKFTGNSTNLRVFGCFDPSEPDYRLMRRFVNFTSNPTVEFNLETNRRFSWISGNDLSKVVLWAIKKKLSFDPSMPDEINVAYPETADLMLSDILDKWCNIHGKDKSYTAPVETNNAYTCDSKLMMSLINQPLDGLEKSLKDYV